MFHRYPLLPIVLLIAINSLNNVLPKQLLNFCLAHEHLRSSKDSWLEERHSFNMTALHESLYWGLQSYLHLCLMSHFLPCQVHQRSKGTIFGRERGSSLVPSEQNWPCLLPIQLSLQITAVEQESYVPPPPSSASPRASWDYFFTPTTHLYKNEQKHLHAPSSSQYSQL